MKRQVIFQTVTLICACVILNSACGSVSTPDPTHEPDATHNVAPTTQVQPNEMATPTPTIEPTPMPVISEDVVEYNILAELDRSSMTLRGTELISYTNGRQQTIDHLLLSVQPNTIPNGFLVDSLQVDGVESDFSLSGQELLLPNVTLEYGSSVEITINFEIALPYAAQGDPSIVRPQIYGYTERQINLVDWYPMITARNTNGAAVLHPLGYYGENLVYPLGSGFISLKLVNFDRLPANAASAPVSVSENTLIYKFSNVRDFTIVLSNSMEFFEDKAEGITLRSYYFPGYETGGQAVLDATRDAVNLYTQVFGPIDNPSITAVQGDFEDGMEYEGLYYLSNSFYNLYDGEADQYLVMVAAHETCHQWFFGNVASDQAIEPWLDESIATYCEKLFYETYYPQYLDWWRAVRIDFYQPQGKIDGNIYDYQGFDPYTNAVYRRGAMYYDDLRKLIGDEAFFAFLKDYYISMDGKVATAEDHFTILRRHTNADLSALIAEYFGNPR